jgi:hypothetical protein
MQVGFHLDMSGIITFKDWQLDGKRFIDNEINIATDENLFTIYNDEKIERYTTDSNVMSVFPYEGDFEFHTGDGAIGFKIV